MLRLNLGQPVEHVERGLRYQMEMDELEGGSVAELSGQQVLEIHILR